MDYSHYKSLATRREGRVLHVTFNSPETLNAFSEQMHDEFEDFLHKVPRDTETHVIVLTGAGKAFSAGGNIDHMQTQIDDQELAYEAFPTAKRLISAFLEVPQPIIGKINGAAIGLGATVALFCDITFAAKKAKIADPHVNVGFVAGDGGAAIWPYLVGFSRAKHYLLTGETLVGEEAERIGLVNFACEPEELDAAVNAYAQKMAAGARRAIQWTKATINMQLKQVAASVMDAGVAYEMLSNGTRDHAEAVAAFRAKRAPNFGGN